MSRKEKAEWSGYKVELPHWLEMPTFGKKEELPEAERRSALWRDAMAEYPDTPDGYIEMHRDYCSALSERYRLRGMEEEAQYWKATSEHFDNQIKGFNRPPKSS